MTINDAIETEVTNIETLCGRTRATIIATDRDECAQMLQDAMRVLTAPGEFSHNDKAMLLEMLQGEVRRLNELTIIEAIEQAASKQFATYRQTRDKVWVACGPANYVIAGREVKIKKKDGKIDVKLIASVGKEFDVDGVPHVYGYIDHSAHASYSPRKNRNNYRCRCAQPVDEGDGECLLCGYNIY